MSTILLWMSPEPGHIWPTLKFARDLQRRGHRVVYQTVRELGAEIEQLGYNTIPFFSSRLPAPASDGASAGFPDVDQLLVELRSHFKNDEAFVSAFSAEICSAAAGIGANLVIVDGVYEYKFHLALQPQLRRQCPVVRLWIHLPPRPVNDGDIDPELGEVVFLSPEELEVPAWRSKEVRYTEASLATHEHDRNFPWEWLDASKPLVYVSLGTQGRRYSDGKKILAYALKTAHAHPQAQFLISAGNACRSLEQEIGLSANAMLLRRTPQYEILKRAAVMITHGGFSTVKECISQGVPMVVAPQMYDQFSNAMRVEYYGLGTTLTSHGSPDELWRVLSDLMERTDNSHAERLKNILWETESKQPTANLCEELMGRFATRKNESNKQANFQPTGRQAS